MQRLLSLFFVSLPLPSRVSSFRLTISLACRLLFEFSLLDFLKYETLLLSPPFLTAWAPEDPRRLYPVAVFDNLSRLISEGENSCPPPSPSFHSVLLRSRTLQRGALFSPNNPRGDQKGSHPFWKTAAEGEEFSPPPPFFPPVTVLRHSHGCCLGFSIRASLCIFSFAAGMISFASRSFPLCNRLRFSFFFFPVFLVFKEGAFAVFTTDYAGFFTLFYF